MNVLPCVEESLAAAADLLNRGGVVVIPTDTVYGLAARPDRPAAVERLYTIKGREAKKPIALLASDAADVTAFGAVLPPSAAALAARYWPGALTLVLPMTGAAAGVWEGFRIPDHAFVRRLLKQCGGVLRVTSANLSGQRPATDAPQALKDVGLDADLVLDDGVSAGGVPSTVVKVFSDGRLDVLRSGAVKL